VKCHPAWRLTQTLYNFLVTSPQFDRNRFYFLATAGTCLLLLVVLTWRQTAVYHNLVTLYTATLTRNPGCWMAHYNLGITLNEQGDTDGAISHYREAV